MSLRAIPAISMIWRVSCVARRTKLGSSRSARVTCLGRIDFKGGSALRPFANMAQVTQSFAAVYDMLEHAAGTIERRADHIRDAQADWIKRRTAVDDRLNDVDASMERLKA